jgi:tetratricopeptide (TPR) repeat protein
MTPELAKCKAGTIVKCVLVMSFIIVPLAGSIQGQTPAPAAQAQSVDSETAQKLILAEGYHDLAVLYIKKGELDMGVAAARQIIQLHFPAEFEKLVAQSLSIITEKLADAHRYDLGQSILDDALKATEQNVNRVKLLRNKARLYMLAGDNDKAIESWRKALELESRRGR